MPGNRSCRLLIVFAVVLKSHVAVHIINSDHKKLALSVDEDDLASVIFEELRTDDASSSKSSPNSDFISIYCHLMWIGLVSNSTILLIHVSIHPKMGLITITKDDFLTKIGDNFQMQSENSRRCLWSLTWSSCVNCTGAGRSLNAAFENLWPAKDRVLLRGVELPVSSSPAHFRIQRQYSRWIWNFTALYGCCWLVGDDYVNRKMGEEHGTLFDPKTHFRKTISWFVHVVEH